MKKLLAMALVGAMTATMLMGCGSKATTEETAPAATEATGTTETSATEDTAATETAGDDTVYKIGIIQLVEHAALDAANKGFVDGLDEAGIKYEVDQQNAQGDQTACDTIASKLVNDGNDLILAIATPAAQAVAGKTTDIPILVTAVTDPATSGLVDTNEVPGGNVSGTSDLTPVKEQIALLTELVPEAKKVGILFCSAEDNSRFQADIAKTEITAAGLEPVEFTVSSSNEIQSVVESMVGKVDALYCPTDNMIAAGMTTVAMVANENGLPVICGESGMVEAGGLATFGIDYYNLGKLTAEQAVKILKGEATPAETPIGYLTADQCEFAGNEETAKALGIDLSAHMK
ncbi:MAG: ABC transporter substrate-binding protein [Lachnospiraceae bacterium]|nr:ABC transporter substrate-binding protein [Lachnospiraceae bacterium]